MSETVACSIALAGLERVEGCGTLLAVAVVEVNVGGMLDLTLQGIQVRNRNGRLLCQAPQWREPKSGRWFPSIVLPPELLTEIGALVLEGMRDMAAA